MNTTENISEYVGLTDEQSEAFPSPLDKENQQQDTAQQSNPLSVSAALSLAKKALEGFTVRLVGEVSELSNKPGYKAVYFTVKDENASLPCMMWNNRYTASGVQLRVGMLVELTGRFTLYAAKGRMNFDVFSLTVAGEGMLRMQVANLARKLQAEGLMDASRKRSLPLYPTYIGLVTSPRGAAVHDVLRTLKRRFPLAQVLLAGVAVEGQSAPAGLIKALHCVCEAGAEVALVVRGGGSFEDLMPFNDEGLARAIAACPIPVVTGIGHEPDTSIADMVADVRASTPTAAAETVSPSLEELQDTLLLQRRSMQAVLQRRLESSKAKLDNFKSRPVFRDSNILFANEAQTLDILSERLGRSIPACIERDVVRLGMLQARMLHSLPAALKHESMQMEALRKRMLMTGAFTPRFDAQIKLMAARLHDLSPLAVLGRGYAMVRKEDGTLVKKLVQAPVNTQVVVSVSDGELLCHVEAARRVDMSVDLWRDSNE